MAAKSTELKSPRLANRNCRINPTADNARPVDFSIQFSVVSVN
jgi:hypothetical protein